MQRYKNVSFHLPEDVVEFAVHMHLFSSFHHPKHSLIPQLSPEQDLLLTVVVVLCPIQVNSLVFCLVKCSSLILIWVQTKLLLA